MTMFDCIIDLTGLKDILPNTYWYLEYVPKCMHDVLVLVGYVPAQRPRPSSV